MFYHDFCFIMLFLFYECLIFMSFMSFMIVFELPLCFIFFFLILEICKFIISNISHCIKRNIQMSQSSIDFFSNQHPQQSHSTIEP